MPQTTFQYWILLPESFRLFSYDVLCKICREMASDQPKQKAEKKIRKEKKKAVYLGKQKKEEMKQKGKDVCSEVGQRHNLPFITCIDDDGNISPGCGKFSGMRRFDARKAVIEALKELGLYRGSEDNAMVVPVCSRSKDIIEPLLKAQWYVKCDEMARKAVAAVESGELKLIPDYHVATWNRWLQSNRYAQSSYSTLTGAFLVSSGGDIGYLLTSLPLSMERYIPPTYHTTSELRNLKNTCETSVFSSVLPRLAESFKHY
ncbi:hypothetical protein NECAME_05693 [Necator americanus]|uniref:valine--tRNA ligase n=1 Tax=Necator americanus TaxID=51031 RepID=W2SHJ4_NECAM|nr:hypothetical protein NECAME_05693 [Necator americanus]ETN68326.1 hypothetical protein NECAME_05693 [Necator americanus]